MISVAIPTHQDRIKYYIHTIKNLYNVVDEFIVVDDASGDKVVNKAKEILNGMSKVCFVPGKQRLGAFRNKVDAVRMCRNPWVALLDSDNLFEADYINAFKKALETMPGCTVYAPVQSRPRFNFREFEGQRITSGNAGKFMENDMFQVLMNTGNYVVDRVKYLEVLEPIFESNEVIPQCCDVCFANYYLLKAGGTIGVAPGMSYSHLDHPESTYHQFVEKEPEETLKWQNMIRSL